MPWLEVNSESTLSFASTLITVSSCVIEHSEHWNKAVGMAICASDVGLRRPNIMNRKTDSTSMLRNNSTLFQSFVDTFN